MITNLFSLWGKQSGLLSQRANGYQVSAILDNQGIWYVGNDQRQLKRAFYKACRRIFLRRLLPFLSPPPSRLSV